MSPEEQQEPGRDGCGAARAQLAAFLGGELSRARQDRLRAHLGGCPACRQMFEGAVGLAARLNRKPRNVRGERARQERRRAQRARALSAAFRLPGEHRGLRLRLILLPALAVFLFTVVARGPSPPAAARIQPVSGAVLLGQEPLPRDGSGHELARGQLCVTGPDGRALLDGSGGSAELGPDTWLWLEDQEGPRLRLGGGELVARGRATLTSQAGVVEVHGGAARVRLQDGGDLEVQALEGEATVADSRGERRVRAGERIRVGRGTLAEGAQPSRFPPR